MHTCNYYCDRPECLKNQRDELRDKWETIMAALHNAKRTPISVDEVRELMTEDRWFLSLLTPQELTLFARLIEQHHGIIE